MDRRDDDPPPVALLVEILTAAGIAFEQASASLQPVTTSTRFWGMAVTAFCRDGDALTAHRANYMAQRGEVLAISGDRSPLALWGGNMAFDAAQTGLAAVLVDGAVRDIDDIRSAGVPTWASARALLAGKKSGAGDLGVVVCCGGMSVAPGDLVIGDADGVIALAPAAFATIRAALEDKMAADAARRQQMALGRRLYEIAGFDLAGLPSMGEP